MLTPLTPTKVYVPIAVSDELPLTQKSYLSFRDIGYPQATFFFTDKKEFSSLTETWLKETNDKYLLSREEMKSLIENAWNECETWKGWTSSTEFEEKKEQFIKSIIGEVGK